MMPIAISPYHFNVDIPMKSVGIDAIYFHQISFLNLTDEELAKITININIEIANDRFFRSNSIYLKFMLNTIRVHNHKITQGTGTPEFVDDNYLLRAARITLNVGSTNDDYQDPNPLILFDYSIRP